MYCRYCGKMIPDDAIFCTYCGEDMRTEKSSSRESERSENQPRDVFIVVLIKVKARRKKDCIDAIIGCEMNFSKAENIVQRVFYNKEQLPFFADYSVERANRIAQYFNNSLHCVTEIQKVSIEKCLNLGLTPYIPNKKQIKCPICGSTSIRKLTKTDKGFRNCITISDGVRYDTLFHSLECTVCGHTF